MALADIARLELPFIQREIGQYTVHITRSERPALSGASGLAPGDGVTPIGATNFRCDHRNGNAGTIIDVSSIKKEKIDEDGSITADQITIQLNDSYRLTGREYNDTDGYGLGTDEDYNTLSTHVGILETIFASGDIYVMDLYLTGADGTEIQIFQGDIDPYSITWDHTTVDQAHTSAEYRTATVTFTVAAAATRLRSYTMDELYFSMGTTARFAALSDEATGDLTVKPFYAGVHAGRNLQLGLVDTPDEIPSFTGTEVTTMITSTYGIQAGSGDASNAVLPFQVSSPRYYEQSSYATRSEANYWARVGVWGIRITTLLKRVCDMAGLGFTFSTDFVPPFSFKDYLWNTGTNEYDATSVTLDTLCVNMNGIFGFVPMNGDEWNTPITIPRDGSVIELIKYFTRFGMQFSIEYDSGPVLRLLNLDEQSGTLPASLRLEASKELQPTNGTNDFIHGKTLGADGGVTVPTGRSGKAIEWEVPLRIRRPGRSDTSTFIFGIQEFLIHNGNLPWFEQYRCYKYRSDEDTAVVDENAWYFTSLLYTYSVVTYRTHYPPSVEPIAPDWAGYYVVSEMRDTALARTWNDTMLGVSNFMARHLVRGRFNLERVYSGVDVDNFASIVPGITSNFLKGGVLTDIEASAVEINLDSTVKITWREIESGTPVVYPWKLDGNANTSNTAGGNGTGNTGSPSNPSSGLWISSTEWDYTDPDTPVPAIIRYGRTSEYGMESTTIENDLSISGSKVLNTMETYGRAPIIVDLICESEPTGNSPPSGSATVDGVAIPLGDSSTVIVMIREGTDSGVWSTNGTGPWVRMTPEYNLVTGDGAPVRVRGGVKNAYSEWVYYAWGNDNLITGSMIKTPVQAAIKWDGNITPSALTIPAPAAVVKVPLASPTVKAGGYNDIIGIDLSTADPDTIQVRLTGTYRISASVKWTPPAGWGGGYVNLQFLDETSTRIGLGILAYQYVPAGAVTTIVHGSTLIDLDRYDIAGGTLPIGVQLGLGHTIAGNQAGTLEQWQANVALIYRGELVG